MFSGGLSLSTANFSNIYVIANKKGYIYMNNTFKDCTSLSRVYFFDVKVITQNEMDILLWIICSIIVHP